MVRRKNERTRPIEATAVHRKAPPEQIHRNGPMVLDQQEMGRRNRIAARRAQAEAERVTVMLKFAHKQWKERK